MYYLRQAAPTFRGETLLPYCPKNQASHLFMTISQKKMTHYPSARIPADMIPGS